MGKADQKRTQNEISRSADSMYGQTNQGINDASSRVKGLQDRSDAERQDIMSRYRTIADTGGVDPDLEAKLRTAFGNFSNSTGGIDPSRISGLDSDANALREFARTGGVSAQDESRIYDPTLQEFSKTGGYSSGDIANIRSRSNSAIASTYGNLKNDLDINKLRGGGIGPGYSEAGFKLARQGAQDIGTNARDTEIGINDSIRSGRMSAADILSQRALGLAGLKSNNTLSGYKGASDIGLNTADLIRKGQEFGASGYSDLAGMKQRGVLAATGGMSDMYKSAPGELTNEEKLLQNYRQMQQEGSHNLINDRIGASRIPGLGSSIKSGIGIAGDIAGMFGGAIPGLGGFGQNSSGNLPSRRISRNSGIMPPGYGGSRITY